MFLLGKFRPVCGGLISLIARACIKCEACFVAFIAVFILSIFEFSSVSNAAICFLPDCAEKRMVFVSQGADVCVSEGYTHINDLTCPEYNNIDYCVDNSSYIKCDTKSWCEDNEYELTECQVPEYLSEQCPNGEFLFRYCTEDFLRACQELSLDYVLECEDGYAKDENELCPYSDDYGKCCNLCEGYDYLYGEWGDGYHGGETCEACGGVTKYKRVVNSCDGYQYCADGGAYGTATCKHGEETWYAECCPNTCTLEVCPEGTECTQETCSGKWCAVGCLVGYENYCDVPEMDCVALGYTDTSCDGAKLICPYDSGRFLCLQLGEEIAEQWCLDNGYNITTCTLPTYPAEQCPTDASYYKTCALDAGRACKETNQNYVETCPTGYQKDESNVCEYDSSYATCCNLCEGFDYTISTVPTGYVTADSCLACGGVTKYKVEIDACEGYQACPNGPQTDSATCQHGDETWYVECCPHACSLEECPEGTICELETCSNKYCAIGCETEYEDYCDVPEMDCAELGYTDTECDGAKYVCPYDSSKFHCIQMGSDVTNQWCLDNGYSVTTCTLPAYPSEQCPNGELVYKACVEDTAKACSELNSNYVATCPTGYAKDESNVCSYDSSYATCCNLCTGFDYLLSEIPVGYTAGESCEACGGVTKYKRVENTCEGFQACPDGYKEGTETCQRGEETWYKECCAYECSLDSCPEGTECRLEECSGKYCAIGCLVGYEEYCDTPIMDCAELGYTETSCEGEKYVCPYDSTKFYCMQVGSDVTNQWCADNGYNVTTCTLPAYLSEQCPNGELVYKACVEDTARACSELNANYVATCPTGYAKDDSDLCTYDESYGACCNLCEGFDYLLSEIPVGYTAGESCEACGGVTKYKRVENTCEGFQACPDGYKEGTATCQRGEETWYAECCSYECSLDSCPEGTECRLETCSGKYCAIGCSTGYEDYCDTPVMDCATLGYTETSCEGDKYVCPYDSGKFYCLKVGSEIAGKWCEDNGYTTTTCTLPAYPSEQCPNGELVYKACVEDTAKACSELNSDYVATCPTGYAKDESNVCSYDSSYATCCNLCTGFDYLLSEIPVGYTAGESCEACGGVTKYKRVENTCEGFQACPDGYKEGTATCQRGEETWYAECCSYECSLDSCPEGTECRLETCSGKYCAIGCSTGYEDYCDTPVMDCATLGYTETSCEGDKYVCPYDSGKFYCIQMGSDVMNQWCLDNGYSVTTCTLPAYPSEQCPNGELVYKACVEDTAKACSELNSDYVATCPTGYAKDESDLCSYDESYGSCCNLCTGFDYLLSEIPVGYTAGESCEACGGVTKYKRVENTCEGFQACPDGYKEGTTTCQHGEETWYAECCAYECSLDSCPEGTDCRLETCSGKYCAIGCLTGYTEYCNVPVMDCATLGYTETSCEGDKYVCPYDSGKFYCLKVGSEIAGKWCEDNGYTTTTCTLPAYPSEQCPNGELVYKACVEDTAKACSELNSDYVATCPTGYAKDESNVCSYDSSYATCCNLCTGFDYLLSEIPVGYTAGESCEACGGVTKYKRVENTCEGFQACPDGYKEGTATCQHGEETWYAECCAYECSLDSCPEGTECRLETCSGKYCAIGCSTGYEEYCDTPVMDCATLGYTETSCEGDKYVCPYDNTKFYCMQVGADVATDWCQDNGYTISSCTLPEYPTDQCPNGETLYKSCVEDTAKACSETNSDYVATCPTGYQKDESNVCSYDSSYGACCNLCEGFDYLAGEFGEGYVAGESCEACGGVTKYKRVENPCAGYQSCVNGGETDTATCQHGTETWYAECCAMACTLDSCPDGTDCYYESCSGKWCAIGCLTNYINYCDTPEMDCAELGYTDTECDGAKLICPYDSGKFHCIQVGA